MRPLIDPAPGTTITCLTTPAKPVALSLAYTAEEIPTEPQGAATGDEPAHGGEAYARLKAALSRLHGTKIETNIVTGGQEEFDAFGLIDAFKIVRTTRDGRMQTVQVTLSDWVFNAIRHKEVLTLHRDYFRLRKPLERRMYELARKHCGQKSMWKISLGRLQEKCGSASTSKEFRRLISKIVEQDEAYAHMPLYRIHEVPELITTYPEFSMFGELPAWGLYVRHVKGLTMRNVRVCIKEDDYRTAMVFDDVKKLSIQDLTVKGDAKKKPLFLKDVLNPELTSIVIK